jgi:alkylation response protein AidB-like acyl-CoA dehydrogenase
MNFGFTDEQEMLREGARRFLEAECRTTLVRRMLDDPTAHPPALWRSLVELGWTGLLVPEAHGGLGGSFVDLLVVLEECGRALLPGPFFATVAAATALVEGGSADLHAEMLPRVARGEVLLSLAVAEADGRFDADGVALAARATDGSFVLRGTKHFVMDAHVADHLVVAARAADGVTLFLVDGRAGGVDVTPVRTVDMTRRLHRVDLRDVSVPAARVLGGAPLLRRTLEVATAAIVAEMVGTAQRALDLTVAYVKERVQFGRPVGSFQAVKHQCVDMLAQVENARSLAYYAAWAVAENAPEARRAVAMAKAYASDMVKHVTSVAIQLHGGIGFTWEHDMHLFHRRALAQEATFGSAPVHRAVVAEALPA